MTSTSRLNFNAEDFPPAGIVIDRALDVTVRTGKNLWKGTFGELTVEDGVLGKKSYALEKFECRRAAFDSFIEPGGLTLSGDYKVNRALVSPKAFPLDAQGGFALFDEPDHKNLEWLRKKYDVNWFDCPGTLIEVAPGRPGVVYFAWDGGSWRSNVIGLHHGFDRKSPSLVYLKDIPAPAPVTK